MLLSPSINVDALALFSPDSCRIRRNGYPIRHTFKEFVDRYRMLIGGVKPSHLEDCQAASLRICEAVLKGCDWQQGHHKIFIKVSIILTSKAQMEVFL